jgi:hypothetical protein
MKARLQVLDVCENKGEGGDNYLLVQEGKEPHVVIEVMN